MMTICIPCGYIYPDKEAFESLPADWCCPECGSSIKYFNTIDESVFEIKNEDGVTRAPD